MAKAVPVSPPDHVFDSLRSPRDFRRVLRNGRRRKVGGVTVATLRRGHGKPAVGLVVGRGVGGAVQRNRARRRIRHALAAIELAQSTDYVVLATKDVGEAHFDTLVSWLEAAVEEND